jgi:hypothetical protein
MISCLRSNTRSLSEQTEVLRDSRPLIPGPNVHVTNI